jgi:hypothetical protein
MLMSMFFAVRVGPTPPKKVMKTNNPMRTSTTIATIAVLLPSTALIQERSFHVSE